MEFVIRGMNSKRLKELWKLCQRYVRETVRGKYGSYFRDMFMKLSEGKMDVNL